MTRPCYFIIASYLLSVNSYLRISVILTQPFQQINQHRGLY